MLPLLSVAMLMLGFSSRGVAQSMDWQLGAQSWTFRMFTFEQALDKIDSCGMKYVEAFPGQTIGGGIPGTMDYHMDRATEKKVLAMVKKHGLKLVSFGVIVPKNSSEWPLLFKFGHDMGLENIVSEPKESDIPLISKLCDKYKINLAIHDHPRPSHYWNPSIVLAAIKGASPRVGACADIGHWTRSGLNPVACLRQLQGHIKELHFKDLNEKSPKAHDVPWGTGVNDIPAVMKELKRQHFSGPVMAEYEYNWYNSVPDVTKCAKYFRMEEKKLGVHP